MPEAEHQPPKKKAPSLAHLLRAAKKLGLDDVRAAEYAGLTPEELQEKTAKDPNLLRIMRQARARGIAESLKGLHKAPQWQAKRYVIETLWCETFGPPPSAASGGKEHAVLNAFREVSKNMTQDQMARAAELLELGRLADNQRNAAAQGADSCQENPQTPSLPPPPASSARPQSPPPSATSVDSSASPGM